MRLLDKTFKDRTRLVGSMLILVAALAACAEPDKKLEECEEGVGSISSTGTLVPANC